MRTMVHVRWPCEEELTVLCLSVLGLRVYTMIWNEILVTV